jgi:hypothetical protein
LLIFIKIIFISKILLYFIIEFLIIIAMKKLVVLLVTLFLFSGLINGQDQTTSANQIVTENQTKEKPNFWFGPKVGMDMMALTTDQNEIKSQLKTNYQAGFFLQFGRTVYFQPEFYYSIHKEGITSTNQAKVTIQSLEIPMLLGIKLINLGVISAHVMGGPKFSILLDETRDTRNYCMCRNGSNFSLQGGGGVDLLGFITVDVRYSVPMEKLVGTHANQYSWENGVNVTVGLKLR